MNNRKEKTLSQIPQSVGLTVKEEATESGAPSRSAEIKLVKFILDSLDEDKAEDVVCIDLIGKSDIADHMVIASGRSTRQVSSLSDKLIDRLKHVRKLSASVEGKEHGDWVLIDAGDVIVHIFRPEVREFYQLEKLWMPAVLDSHSS